MVARNKLIVRDKNGGLKRVQRKFAELEANTVAVGIFDDDDLSLIAFANEFGTDTIPERPFMRTALENNKDAISDQLEKSTKRVFEGIRASQAMEPLGELGVDLVQASIDDFDDPPNAPSTIAKKGFDDPLIETGELRDAFDWEIARSDKLSDRRGPGE